MRLSVPIFSRVPLAAASAAALLLALSPASAVHAQFSQTTGANSAVVGTPDRVATFNSVVTGTNLTNYSENGLFITVPDTALTGFDPTGGSGLGGFSGGFHFPNGTVNAFTNLRATDGGLLTALELNVGSGFVGNQTNLYYQALLSGAVVGSGALAVTSGTVVGFASTVGFDQINLGAASSLTAAQTATATTQNGLAVDNVRVRLANTANVAPEPGSLALAALPLLGSVGVVLRRRKK